MKRYIAYTRVSTARQGEKGSSLPEQKSIIEGYAKREGLEISAWFEERETAAKVGRTIFKQMMQVFSRGGAEGLILHKIDRGARNLKDWALLSELTDTGVDVRIAGDSIDMTSRGGRLSADIQAVVAADYIRNLREEVKKGQQGRLKAGLFPWAAPMGYLDMGEGGTGKCIDPVTAPLIRRTFEEYADGRHTLKTLTLAMHEWGLSTKNGKPLALGTVNLILRRPFYIGLIRVKGMTYVGKHEPLISKALFDQVQDVLDGRSADRVIGKVDYALRRIMKCAVCDRYLYAERQKGHHYYRCHTKECKGTCIRESAVLGRIADDISRMALTDGFLRACSEVVSEFKADAVLSAEAGSASTSLMLSQVEGRSLALTDAYLDRLLDKEDYEARRAKINLEKISLREKLVAVSEPSRIIDLEAERFFELIRGLRDLKKLAKGGETRKLLLSSFSNLFISKKTIDMEWKKSLSLLLEASPYFGSGHARDSYRTFDDERAVRELAERVMKEVLREVMESHPIVPPMSGSPDVHIE